MTPLIQEYSTLISAPTCKCNCGRQVTLHVHKNGKTIPGVYNEYIQGHASRKATPIVEAMPFKIDGVYCRLIPLTQGLWAIVWEIHYGYLMQWKWFAQQCEHSYYPKRWILIDPAGKWASGNLILFPMQNALMAPEEGKTIDHKNRVGLDCRYDNLRQASQGEQNMNRRKLSGHSLYRGVIWWRTRGIYLGRITLNKRQVCVYRGPSELEAAIAVDAATRKYQGEFARLNFPD